MSDTSISFRNRESNKCFTSHVACRGVIFSCTEAFTFISVMSSCADKDVRLFIRKDQAKMSLMGESL